MSYLVGFFVVVLKWEVIVRFADIGGIYYHYRLNFLFIIMKNKTKYQANFLESIKQIYLLLEVHEEREYNNLDPNINDRFIKGFICIVWYSHLPHESPQIIWFDISLKHSCGSHGYK